MLCGTLVVILLAAFEAQLLEARHQKIVGGTPLAAGSAPYLVSLTNRGRHVCGGSIIGDRTIVTAAHCVTPYQVRNLAIRAGSNSLRAGGVVRSIASVRSHPNFRQRTFNYDIAMLYLGESFNFTDGLQPVQLYQRAPRNNQAARISGWGVVRETGRNPSNVARTTVIRMVSRTRCRRIYRQLLQSTMICAGVSSGARDACQGDSGGPLLIQGRLAGIISVGSGCGRRGLPGLYTNVPLLRRWIVANT